MVLQSTFETDILMGSYCHFCICEKQRRCVKRPRRLCGVVIACSSNLKVVGLDNNGFKNLSNGKSSNWNRRIKELERWPMIQLEDVCIYSDFSVMKFKQNESLHLTNFRAIETALKVILLANLISQLKKMCLLS